MLIAPADFVGEYRLHNVNNLNPDLIAAIDQAQTALTLSLFRRGAQAVLANPPAAAPNIALRNLRLTDVFLPWCFMRVQLAVLGAGVNKNSEFPTGNVFASTNFVTISASYKRFLDAFAFYERLHEATAIAADTLQLNYADQNWQDLLFVGAEVSLLGVGTLNVLSVTILPANTNIQFSTSPFTIGQTYRFRQVAIEMDKRTFIYF